MTEQEETIDLARSYFKVSTQATMAFRQFMQQKFKSTGVDLTFEMAQVLNALAGKDGVNQQEIANATVKDKASLTYLIDNLSIRGLVYRQEDEADRRNKLIFLTPKGRQLLQDTLLAWADEMYTLAAKDINPGDIQLVISVMERIVQNLKN